MTASKTPQSPRKSNGCLIALIVVIALLVVSVAAMALLRLCPPQGPWPTPPWCSGDSANNIQTMVEGYLKENTKIGEMVAAVVPEQDPAYFAQIPTPMPAGQETPLSFQIALPENSTNAFLEYQRQKYPLQAQSPYYFTLDGLSATTGEELAFTIQSGDLTTGELHQTFTGEPLRVAANWTNSDQVQKDNFMKGHAIMDAGGNIPIITRTGSIASTMDAMRADGAQWFAYDYYWAYSDTAAPLIIDESTVDPSAADEETLAKMITMVHERGMHYLMLTELEWIVMPEERAQAGDTIDEWMAF